MKKDVLDYVVAKTHELMNASSCSAEAKAAAQKWLDAAGTEHEAEATQAYLAELEADIMPIDQLIAFSGSEAGVACFGADTAKQIYSHAVEIKAAGAVYCECPACAAAAAILSKKGEML